MTRTVQQLGLIAAAVAAVAIASGAAVAADRTKKPAPPKRHAPMLAMPAFGNMVHAASDLRKAGEAFERFGDALKVVVPTFSRALTDSSRNLANIGQGFDPMGLKAAFSLIREQQEVIYKLQQAQIERRDAEIEQLKAQCESLRKQLAERQQPKPRKHKKHRRK